MPPPHLAIIHAVHADDGDKEPPLSLSATLAGIGVRHRCLTLGPASDALHKRPEFADAVGIVLFGAAPPAGGLTALLRWGVGLAKLLDHRPRLQGRPVPVLMMGAAAQAVMMHLDGEQFGLLPGAPAGQVLRTLQSPHGFFSRWMWLKLAQVPRRPDGADRLHVRAVCNSDLDNHVITTTTTAHNNGATRRFSPVAHAGAAVVGAASPDGLIVVQWRLHGLPVAARARDHALRFLHCFAVMTGVAQPFAGHDTASNDTAGAAPRGTTPCTNVLSPAAQHATWQQAVSDMRATLQKLPEHLMQVACVLQGDPASAVRASLLMECLNADRVVLLVVDTGLNPISALPQAVASALRQRLVVVDARDVCHDVLAETSGTASLLQQNDRLARILQQRLAAFLPSGTVLCLPTAWAECWPATEDNLVRQWPVLRFDLGAPLRRRQLGLACGFPFSNTLQTPVEAMPPIGMAAQLQSSGAYSKQRVVAVRQAEQVWRMALYRGQVAADTVRVHLMPGSKGVLVRLSAMLRGEVADVPVALLRATSRQLHKELPVLCEEAVAGVDLVV